MDVFIAVSINVQIDGHPILQFFFRDLLPVTTSPHPTAPNSNAGIYGSDLLPVSGFGIVPEPLDMKVSAHTGWDWIPDRNLSGEVFNRVTILIEQFQIVNDQAVKFFPAFDCVFNSRISEAAV